MSSQKGSIGRRGSGGKGVGKGPGKVRSLLGAFARRKSGSGGGGGPSSGGDDKQRPALVVSRTKGTTEASAPLVLTRFIAAQDSVSLGDPAPYARFLPEVPASAVSSPSHHRKGPAEEKAPSKAHLDLLVKATAEALAAPGCAIRSLSIGHTTRVQQLMPLLATLRSNTSLTELSLDACVEKQHASALASAVVMGLATNETVTRLTATNCGFTDQNETSATAVRLLRAMLVTNYTLTSMDLGPLVLEPDAGATSSGGDRGSTADGSDNDDTSVEAQVTNVHRAIEQNEQLRDLKHGASKLVLTSRLLTHVPEFALQLTHLTTLDLQCNELTDVSPRIGTLCQLHTLNLCNNRLTRLPEQLVRLPKLSTLNVSGNQLKALPCGVANLTSLTCLHVEDNQLQRLPWALGVMTSVKELHAHNAFAPGFEPTDVSLFAAGQLDGAAYVNQIQSSFDTSTRPAGRIKVDVSGPTNVGKTVLISSLMDVAQPSSDSGGSMGRSWGPRRGRMAGSVRKRALIRKSMNMHHGGIQVQHMSLREGRNDEIHYAMWDFGDEKVHRMAHTILLTSRTLYVLVFDMSDPELPVRDLRHRIEEISSRVPNAPLLIVGTHVDSSLCTTKFVNHRIEVLSGKLDSLFENIEGYAAVSPMSGEGIGKLLKTITDVAMDQPSTYEQVPVRFCALEDELRSRRALAAAASQPPILSWSEYLDVAAAMHLTEDEATAAATYMYDCGVILYVAEHSELRDSLFLDPLWLVSVLEVVYSKELVQSSKNGRLSVKNLNAAWEKAGYSAALHPALLQLLIQFDLAFVDSNDAYVMVPSLTSDEVPPRMAELWPKLKLGTTIHEYQRCYHFPILPSMFHGLLLSRLVRHGFKADLVWSNGFLLSKGEERMLAESHVDEEDMLRISVRSEGRSRFAFTLFEGITRVITDWIECGVDVTVPCQHCTARGFSPPYTFKHEDLQVAASQGRFFVTCGFSQQLISLRLLAPDLSLDALTQTVPFSQIELGDVIGEGGFAKVHRAKYKGGSIAVKLLTVQEQEQCPMNPDEPVEDLQRKAYDELRREVFLMSSLQHDNLVCLLGVCSEPFAILLEYMDGGDLYAYIHNESEPLNLKLQLKFAQDICNGMRYLHAATPSVVHRDLKSPNILLSRESRRGRLVAKVSDFGLSFGVVGFADSESAEPVDNPVWVAPEVLAKQPCTRKSDVYAMGVILYELATRKDFLADKYSFMSQMEQAIMAGERPEVPSDCVLKELMQQCWHTKPEERPEFSQLLVGLRAIRHGRSGAESVAMARATSLETVAPRGTDGPRSGDGARKGTHRSVERASDSPSRSRRKKGSGRNVRRRAIAAFTFEPSTEDQETRKLLPLVKGQELLVVGSAKSGWWRAEVNGHRGYVPANHVHMLKQRRSSGPRRGGKASSSSSSRSSPTSPTQGKEASAAEGSTPSDDSAATESGDDGAPAVSKCERELRDVLDNPSTSFLLYEQVAKMKSIGWLLLWRRASELVVRMEDEKQTKSSQETITAALMQLEDTFLGSSAEHALTLSAMVRDRLQEAILPTASRALIVNVLRQVKREAEFMLSPHVRAVQRVVASQEQVNQARASHNQKTQSVDGSHLIIADTSRRGSYQTTSMRKRLPKRFALQASSSTSKLPNAPLSARGSRSKSSSRLRRSRSGTDMQEALEGGAPRRSVSTDGRPVSASDMDMESAFATGMDLASVTEDGEEEGDEAGEEGEEEEEGEESVSVQEGGSAEKKAGRGGSQDVDEDASSRSSQGAQLSFSAKLSGNWNIASPIIIWGRLRVRIGRRGRWQKKIVVLTRGSLILGDSETDAHPSHILSLATPYTVGGRLTDKDHGFEVQFVEEMDGPRSYQFRTGSEIERTNWRQRLVACTVPGMLESGSCAICSATFSQFRRPKKCNECKQQVCPQCAQRSGVFGHVCMSCNADGSSTPQDLMQKKERRSQTLSQGQAPLEEPKDAAGWKRRALAAEAKVVKLEQQVAALQAQLIRADQ